MSGQNTPHKTAMSAYKTGFLCHCPACGSRTLYNGVLQVHDSCSACHFPLANHDAADGPAYIAICLVGALITITALMIEIFFAPPFWVHVVVWIPVTLIGSVLCLRVAKSILISLQYMYKLQEDAIDKQLSE